MRPLERIPAVRRLQTDREDVFAVDVTGEFTAADAENLCGLLEGAYAIHDRIDLIARLTGLEQVDLDGLSGETAILMREHLNQHVARCAIIGDTSRAAQVERLFSSGTSAELRHFTRDRDADAWAWIGATEIPEQV
jgi:hypothetical protein